MEPAWKRIAYAIEFLLATLAIFTVWSQVGGQGHLDLMPWYTKMVLTASLGLATVSGTASAVAHERAWDPQTITCLPVLLVLAVAVGGGTAYYHLHHNDQGTA